MELATLLNKYRSNIKDECSRSDEDWISIRIPYSFMVGDVDFSYDRYIYICNNKECNIYNFNHIKY